MPLILVYHRVGEGPKFHDVSMSAFDRQIQLLEKHGICSSTIISFDDGTSGHWAAAERLEQAGLRGLFLVSPAKLDRPGRLSSQQVRDLCGRGHLIGSHGMTHTTLDQMNQADCLRELQDSRHFLQDLTGNPIEWLAPPGGIIPPGLPEMALETGYRYVRSMRWGYAQSLDEQPALPVFPINRRTTDRYFQKLLDGQASRTGWLVRQWVKKSMGHHLWTWCRENFG